MSEQPPLPPAEEIRQGHEGSGVRGYGFLIFVTLFLAGLGSISLFLIWLLRTLAAETSTEPSSALALRLRPQGPQLQSSIIHPAGPRQDLDVLRKHYRHVLESYGWVDKQKQIVHIPIERAMSIYLERGAPASAPADGIESITRPAQSRSSAVSGDAR